MGCLFFYGFLVRADIAEAGDGIVLSKGIRRRNLIIRNDKACGGNANCTQLVKCCSGSRERKITGLHQGSHIRNTLMENNRGSLGRC